MYIFYSPYTKVSFKIFKAYMGLTLSEKALMFVYCSYFICNSSRSQSFLHKVTKSLWVFLIEVGGLKRKYFVMIIWMLGKFFPTALCLLLSFAQRKIPVIAGVTYILFTLSFMKNLVGR